MVVKKNNMNSNKYFIITVLLFLFVITFSCKKYHVEDCENYDYYNCNTVEPFEGILEIELTINNLNPRVPLVVFNGNFEDHDTAFVDTATTKFLEIHMPTNQYYSVLAKYKTSEKTIFAVDGDDITKKSENVCDSVCWILENGKIDVKLKYD